MKNLYLLSLLMLVSMNKELDFIPNQNSSKVTVIEMIENTENPPTISFSETNETIHQNNLKYFSEPVYETVYSTIYLDTQKENIEDFTSRESYNTVIENNFWNNIFNNNSYINKNEEFEIYKELFPYINLAKEKIEEMHTEEIRKQKETEKEKAKELRALKEEYRESSSDLRALKEEYRESSSDASIPVEKVYNIVKTEGIVNVSNVSVARSYFNKIPENVKEFIQDNGVQIFVTDRNLAQRFFSGQYNSVMGCTVYADKTIYLEDRTSAITSSVIHETGHILDYLLGWVSSSQEFTEYYNSEKDSFIEVGKQDNNSTSSTMEYFAEVWNQSILYPESCKSSAPNSYVYVTRIMSNL